MQTRDFPGEIKSPTQFDELWIQMHRVTACFKSPYVIHTLSHSVYSKLNHFKG